MTAPTRWRKALDRVDELEDLEGSATSAPWEAYRRHAGLGRPDAIGIVSEAPENIDGVELLEDPDCSVVDAEIIATARNLLPGLLQVTRQVLAVHEPYVDPDGDAICRHCVVVESTHLWPCDAAAVVLAAIEPRDDQ